MLIDRSLDETKPAAKRVVISLAPISKRGIMVEDEKLGVHILLSELSWICLSVRISVMVRRRTEMINGP